MEDGAGGYRPVASVQVDDAEVITWDEAAEREHRATVPLAALLAGGVDSAFQVPGSESVETLTDGAGRCAGRLVRRQAPLTAVTRLRAERLPGPYGALRLRVTIENRTIPDGPLRRRDDGLRLALIAAHALIGVPGRQVPVADRSARMGRRRTPRRASTPAPGRCWPARRNAGSWCFARRSSSTTTREIAAESAGDLFDATEIDEILTLRTLALTDEEKRRGPRHRPARGRAAWTGWTACRRRCSSACTAPSAISARPAGTGTGQPGIGVPVTGGPEAWRAGGRHAGSFGAVVGSGLGRQRLPGDRPRPDRRGCGWPAAAGS